MRVAPVGIVYSWRKITHLVEAAFQASMPTHGGQFGICAAASFAAAVSSAIDNASCDNVLNASIYAAREAERLRPPSPVGNMSAALQHMYAELAPLGQELPARLQEEDCFRDRPIVTRLFHRKADARCLDALQKNPDKKQEVQSLHPLRLRVQ
jgi:hypothetical protein